MKAQKTYFLAAGLFLLASGLAAQVHFAIGPRIGFNSATQLQLDYDDDVISTDAIIGFTAAAVFELQLGKVYALQPEIGLTQKGFSYTFSGDIRYNYLELVLLNKFEFGGDVVKGFVGLGPSFGYLASGKVSDITIEYWDNYNRLEVGFVLSGGVEIKLGPGYLGIGPRFSIGLTDVINDSNFSDLQTALNITGGLGVSYAFQIGGD
ncbi:MAG: PorT family protein [Lewinellaceae bacterium]|nr:PorT family protein [Saprospiraceae bacterium]MCB9337978.1 PorT family protein [Lewinellaceae bacterium]